MLYILPEPKYLELNIGDRQPSHPLVGLCFLEFDSKAKWVETVGSGRLSGFWATQMTRSHTVAPTKRPNQPPRRVLRLGFGAVAIATATRMPHRQT